MNRTIPDTNYDEIRWMFRLPLSLHPAYQLILTCARVDLSAAQQARVQSLASQITDWDEVLNAADFHGVYSLVANNLNAMCADRMPPQVLEKLRSKRALYRARTLVKLTALIKVLRVLRENNIQGMPLKGAALAGMVYSNSLLSDFTNLDILVQSKDLSRTIAILDQLGYKPVDEHLAFPQRGSFPRLTGYAQLFKRQQEKGFILLDLHWRVMPPFLAIRPDHRALWTRASNVTLFGMTVPALNKEDLILLLCMYGSKRGWADLKTVVDLAEALRTLQTLDWSLLARDARALGVERMVALGLGMVAGLLDGELPASARILMERDNAGQALAARLIERYDADHFVQPANAITAHLFISISERRIDKLFVYLALLRRIAPNDNDRAFVALPRQWKFLYYFVRPIRLAKDYGTEFLKAMVE